MDKKVLNSLPMFLVVMFFMMFVACDDFESETYEMSFQDKIAREAFEDPLLSDTTYYTGVTVKVDTSLAKTWTETVQFSLLIGNSGASSSFATDSLYIFYIDTTLKYHVKITDLSVAQGMKKSCEFDTTFNVKDTLTSKQDSVIFTTSIPLKKEYFVSNFSTKYANGMTVLFSSVDLDSLFDNFDIFNALVYSKKELITTLCTYKIVTGSTPDSTYLILNIPTTGTTYFYFDDYVKMNVYDLNTSKKLDNHSIPLETTANYFTIKDNKPVPIIKARYEYMLDTGKYIIEFISTDQTLSSTFRTVILREI